MADTSIVLGVAGDMVHGPTDPYTTKVGGSPVWMGSRQDGCPSCKLCGATLSLVMQCYAPLASAACGRNVSNRAVHVFGCTATSCRNQPGSWRAFRSQAPEDMQGSAAAAPAEPPKAPADSDWGLEGADDWSAADADAAGGPAAAASGGGGALDVSDLAKELKALDSLKAEAELAAEQKKQEAARQLQEQRAAAAAAAATRAVPSHLALPEFYLAADCEPAPDDAPAVLDKASKRALELLEEYQQRQDQAGASTVGDGSAGGAAGDDGGEGAEAWGNEQYEAVTVRGVDKAHYRFLKRIQLYPEQCVRYGFNAEPLFPTGRRPPASACARCGSPRVFEVQVVPPLLHYLDEAFDMEKVAQSAIPARKELRRRLEDWDWTAVFVYSCSKSCCKKGSGGGEEAEIVEEEVWVDSAEENLTDIQRTGSPIPPVASSA